MFDKHKTIRLCDNYCECLLFVQQPELLFSTRITFYVSPAGAILWCGIKINACKVLSNEQERRKRILNKSILIYISKLIIFYHIQDIFQFFFVTQSEPTKIDPKSFITHFSWNIPQNVMERNDIMISVFFVVFVTRILIYINLFNNNYISKFCAAFH